MSRGRSAEPELFQPATLGNPEYVSRRQMRARSAGPQSSSSKRASKLLQHQGQSGDRALINQHVNPYQEFPSLRRGFTLEGVPILEKDELVGDSDGGDACAYYFWAITLFFFTLAFINFVILMVIMGVLGIGPAGMDSIEFLPDHGSVKFLKDLIAPSITIGSGLISGYAGEDMNVVADNGDIVFQVRGVLSEHKPQLRISPHEISFNNVDNFKVIDPATGLVYFDAFAPEFTMTDPVESLAASEVETNNLVSPIGKDLLIKSDSGLDLQGAEGIDVEAKNIRLEAGEHMELTSKEGSITFDGKVTLDPLALPVGGGGYPGETNQFKVCVCGKTGKLFSVPVISKSKLGTRSPGEACLQQLWKVHPCDE